MNPKTSSTFTCDRVRGTVCFNVQDYINRRFLLIISFGSHNGPIQPLLRSPRVALARSSFHDSEKNKKFLSSSHHYDISWRTLHIYISWWSLDILWIMTFVHVYPSWCTVSQGSTVLTQNLSSLQHWVMSFNCSRSWDPTTTSVPYTLRQRTRPHQAYPGDTDTRSNHIESILRDSVPKLRVYRAFLGNVPRQCACRRDLSLPGDLKQKTGIFALAIPPAHSLHLDQVGGPLLSCQHDVSRTSRDTQNLVHLIHPIIDLFIFTRTSWSHGSTSRRTDL